MKSVLNFLSLFTFLLLPMIAKGDSSCSGYTTKATCEDITLGNVCIWNDSECVERCPKNQDGTCQSYNGCEYMAGDCAPCSQGTYNDGNNQSCQPCPNGYNDGWATSNKHHIKGETSSQCEHWECDTYYYKSNDGNSCERCPSQGGNGSLAIVTKSSAQVNIGSCKCTTVSTTNNNCNSISSNETTPYQLKMIHAQTLSGHIYYCGLCGAAEETLASSATSVTECTCGNSDLRKAIVNNGEPSSSCPDVLIQCLCPDSSTYDNTNGSVGCKCNDSNKVITVQDGCVCNIGSYTAYSDPNNCTACPTGQTTKGYNTGQTDPNIIPCYYDPCAKFFDSNSAWKRYIQITAKKINGVDMTGTHYTDCSLTSSTGTGTEIIDTSDTF